MLLFSTEFKNDELSDETRLVITARNTGRRPVLLSQGGLRFKGTQHAFTGEGWDKQYPMRLDEGESGDTWVSLNRIHARLRQDERKPPIWAYFQTEVGKTYKSRIPRAMERVLLEDWKRG